MKRELSQLHEYQVDNLVVSSGIDPVEYNFILIRFRAGMQKFAIANGLKNSRIKKRIIMINTRISKKGNWKYFLLIPAICILLLSLSFSSIKPEKADNIPLPAVESVQEKDSVKIKLITLPEDFIIQNNKNIAIVPKDLESVILVLMNKISDVAINGKFAPEGKRVSMLIREYEKSREDRFFQNQSPKVKIITQKDMNAVEEDYKALLDEISTAIYTMHESWAKELYNKPFNELNTRWQKQLDPCLPY